MIGYKSREDCIVKHLERRELAKCGCNKRWTYRSLGFGNYSNICGKAVKCYIDLRFEMKSLEKICRKKCLNQHFYNIIASSRYQIYHNKVMIFTYLKTIENEITFTHLPKMNLVEYFGSIGGLISMWFGISVYDLVLIFVRESKNTIISLLRLINFEMKILMIFKFKNLISRKFNLKFSKITIIVFSAIMLYQFISLMMTYFDYEIVTRFEVQQIISMPEITIFKKSENILRMAKHIIDIYPEYRGVRPSRFVKSYAMEILKKKIAFRL
jgi:hypothetical protein